MAPPITSLVGQINTILELAEINAGLKVMTMEQVDLARIVNMAVESVPASC